MAQLRSSWTPIPSVDFDVSVRHVGKLERAVPAYTAADLRLAWRVTPGVEISGVVRNAFDHEHVEWQNQGLVPRSFFLHVRWQS
jgi:outer membrane receptor protein involved in Fe transport